jgi:DNA-binding beta-propeller fold protein YncE
MRESIARRFFFAAPLRVAIVAALALVAIAAPRAALAEKSAASAEKSAASAEKSAALAEKSAASAEKNAAPAEKNAASVGTDTDSDAARKGERVVFPAPPAQARIEYLGAVRDNADYIGKRGWWQKVTQLVIGSKDPTALGRPYGVEASGPMLYVCDQTAGAVHGLDTDNMTYGRIPKEGRLASPIDVAVDSKEFVYVTDSKDGSVYCYDHDGERVRVVAHGLSRPTGIAYGRSNDLLYVVDTGAHVVRMFTTTGEVAGSFGSRGEEPGFFNFPVAIFIDQSGTVYVTDSMNFRVQAFTLEGEPIHTFGELGDRPGYFSKPKGVASDSDGNIYVVDAMFDAVQIFDASGQLLLSFGGGGAGAGEFWLPAGITVDGEDRIYVADSYNGRVQIFQYLKE